MLPEFSFPTVMYGIKILLCAFVCGFTLTLMRPYEVALSVNFDDRTWQPLPPCRQFLHPRFVRTRTRLEARSNEEHRRPASHWFHRRRSPLRHGPPRELPTAGFQSPARRGASL